MSTAVLLWAGWLDWPDFAALALTIVNLLTTALLALARPSPGREESEH